MKKPKLTADNIINWWLKKYHNTTLEEAYAKEPWTDSRVFYERYPVTKEQHDEWHEWMITALMKDTKMSRKYVERSSPFIYLNCAPNIKEEDQDNDIPEDAMFYLDNIGGRD
jgi:hypothetical protein